MNDLPELIKKAIELTIRETTISRESIAKFADSIRNINTIGLGSEQGITIIFNTIKMENIQDEVLSFLFEFKSQLELVGIPHDMLTAIYNNSQISVGSIVRVQEVYDIVKWNDTLVFSDTVLGCIVLLKLYFQTFANAITKPAIQTAGAELI